MWIKVGGKNTVEIEDKVVKRILTFYPEEELMSLKDFEEAFIADSITISKLKKKSEAIFIPWQMFFLTSENLENEFLKIEKLRIDKFPDVALLVKRKGQGDVTSKRVLDRLLRVQNFVSTKSDLPNNTFCGSLKDKNPKECADFITNHFNIDITKFRKDTAKIDDSLKYISERIQSRNINISSGVLSNGMLLNHQVVKGKIYKNTSGFAIRDEKIPFIFLPSEINPDEVSYRQIYTLLYLLVAIGLEQYDYFVESGFSYKKLQGQNMNQKMIHRIVSEFLLPFREIEPFRGTLIGRGLLDELKIKYKMSPTAILTTLRVRRIIDDALYEELKPADFVPVPQTNGTPRKAAKISTSVLKFCGGVSFSIINTAIKNSALNSIPAQYLIFGRVRIKKYKEYLQQI